jgi:hypothetical protein
MQGGLWRHRDMRNHVVRLLIASALLSMLAACGEPATEPTDTAPASTSYRGTQLEVFSRGGLGLAYRAAT